MPRFYSNVVRPSSNKAADPGKEKKGSNAGKGKDDKDPAGDGKKEDGGGE